MSKKVLVLLVFLLFLVSLSMVSAEKIRATPEDSFAYYGADTPAGQSAYNFAIEVDSNVYYISDYIAEELASYSLSFRRVYAYDLEKYGRKFTPDAVSFGSNGFNMYYQTGNQYDDEMFQFVNDETFDFDYKSGQRVGYNSNAKVITDIYYPEGGRISDTT